MQLVDFVEIALDERVRKLALGQIILIDQGDAPMKLQRFERELLKARDPKLSRTLYPPFGQPMFKQDTELEKWLRSEMQIQTRRDTAKASEANAKGSH